MDAHRRRADEARNVGRYAALLEPREILAEAGPRDIVFHVAQAGRLELLHFFVERTHGPALAHHLQRHALLEVAEPAPVDDQRFGRPAVRVDESRRHGEAGGVDFGPPTRGAANGNHLVAVDGNIAHRGRAARAVVDRAAPNHEVVKRGRSASRRAGRKRQGDADGKGNLCDTHGVNPCILVARRPC